MGEGMGGGEGRGGTEDSHNIPQLYVGGDAATKQHSDCNIPVL